LSRITIDEQQADGCDIADFILAQEIAENYQAEKILSVISKTDTRLQLMIDHNPALRILIDKFGLELIEVTV